MSCCKNVFRRRVFSLKLLPLVVIMRGIVALRRWDSRRVPLTGTLIQPVAFQVGKGSYHTIRRIPKAGLSKSKNVR